MDFLILGEPFIFRFAIPRKRAPPSDNSAHTVKLASTLDFHGVWRELKAAGWTSKPPRGLDNRYRYVLPGCSSNGQIREDYLLGEECGIALSGFRPRLRTLAGSVGLANRDQECTQDTDPGVSIMSGSFGYF
ncbi:unnamed protein product [Phytophthora fragariaefolia]|uniref:Unnamed protein product n=1 Tax=Phytophthora fragariaefolia TaxID=1490495 RepID=A0A9W6Y4E2_9STRA|nr:unnamed protein product [Phytophthora fragariaefolia]